MTLKKLWAIAPGMLSFMSVFTIVFDGFEIKGGWDNHLSNHDDRNKH